MGEDDYKVNDKNKEKDKSKKNDDKENDKEKDKKEEDEFDLFKNKNKRYFQKFPIY